MTIACECGGAVEIEEQTYGEDMAFESYECVSCESTGTLIITDSGTSLSGCLVRQ